MVRFRNYLFTILLLWPLMAIAQSHDFEIRNFHENITDLSAVSADIRDLNGNQAALIRIVVRNQGFEFEANNGILKQERKTGEVWLFVPRGTKRLNIRHPSLGVLRDYDIPVTIKEKTTYDAEIVVTKQEYPVYEDHGQDLYKPSSGNNMPETHFLIGAGFNALSVMGPSLSMGLEIGNFFVGADFTYGIDKVEGVGINYKKGGQTTLGEAYDYSAYRTSLRIGMNFMTESSFQVVPQVGASMSFISGSAISDIKGIDTQFEKSSPISAFLALSLRVKLGETFLLHVTPQYDFAVSTDDVYKVIKEADSKIKAWGEGFGVCAGVTLRF